MRSVTDFLTYQTCSCTVYSNIPVDASAVWKEFVGDLGDQEHKMHDVQEVHAQVIEGEEPALVAAWVFYMLVFGKGARVIAQVSLFKLSVASLQLIHVVQPPIWEQFRLALGLGVVVGKVMPCMVELMDV